MPLAQGTKKSKIKPEDVGLLVFDLDGTLLKSNKVNFEAMKAGLADLDWDIGLTQGKIDRIMGETNENAYKKLLPPDKFLQRTKLVEKTRSHYAPMILKYGRIFPGVLETLKILKSRGYKLALYSYASGDYFAAAISALGIGNIFDYAENTEKHNLTKIKLVKKIKARFPKLKAAIIGDSIHDIDTARKTGALAVGAGWGYGGKELEAADIMIKSFPELLDIFDRRRPIFGIVLEAIKKRKNPGKAFVVGINGIDAAGKTEFAKGLGAFLNSNKLKTQVICVDDFRNPASVRHSGSSPVESYYSKSFDLSAVGQKILSPLSDDGCLSVTLMAYNDSTDKYDVKKFYHFDKSSIIVLEGVFIFKKELESAINFKIFLDIPFGEFKRRSLARDVPIYGQYIVERYDTRYIPAQKMYFKEVRPKKIADMVIDNIDWNRPVIKKHRYGKI